ncbi:hypothetical protein BX600DRAFT_116200 [Xylariales sp. PMI_506]|nr:hypothetical protein BX600DRAFT_116200 [Xylariales sp. PMI_506]
MTKSLVQLIGSYDNLSEPTPSWNNASTIIAAGISMMVLSYFCVIFRLYTRFCIVKSPGWDDLFVVLVLLSGSLGTICVCLATTHGSGKHFITLGLTEMSAYLKTFYIANASFSMSIFLVKLALLLQYLRIFRQDNFPRTDTFCRILVFFVSLWGAAFSFMAWFPCFPVAGYWDWTLDAKCYGYGSLDPDVFYAIYAASSSMNLVFDVIILAIPVQLYFGEDSSRRTKMGLLAVLFMGGLVNFFSIWRVATIVQHRATTYPTFDPTWYGPISILLACLEVDVSIMCASIPVFWPVVTSRLDRIFVTQEIKIERAHRFSTIDDEYELHRGPSYTAGVPGIDGEIEPRSPSRASSGRSSSLNRSRSQKTGGYGRDGYYKDKYIMAQVDPLSAMKGVESEIRAEPVSGRRPSRGV